MKIFIMLFLQLFISSLALASYDEAWKYYIKSFIGNGGAFEKVSNEDRVNYLVKAINSLRDDPDYYDDAYYIFDSSLQTSIAYTYLMDINDPKKAGEWYKKSILSFQEGVEKHKQIEKNIANQNTRTLNFLLKLLKVTAARGQGGGEGDKYTRSMEAIDSHKTINFHADLSNIPGVALEIKEFDGDIYRIPVIPDQGFLKAIGRVIVGGKTCTGTLVLERIVLTSDFCVNSSDIKFTFERHDGVYTYDVETWFTSKGEKEPSSVTDFESPESSFAFLILNTPVTGDISTPLEIFPHVKKRNLNAYSEKVILAGYSSDLNSGKVLSMHSGCSITQVKNKNITHNCITSDGAIGAPIFLKDRVFRTASLIGFHRGNQNNGSEGIGSNLKESYKLFLKLKRIYSE